MTRKLFSFLFLTLFLTKLQAQDSLQSSIIQFEETTHDFGSVNEAGAITHEFKFKNKGKVPVMISNVRASCGCTTTGWTKEPIMPGKSGVITAQYNTLNRPGVFKKNLTVIANTEPAMTMLFIKGNVIPKIKTPAELYPKKIGKVRMFSEHVYLGRITTKDPFIKEIILYNEGTEAITFSAQDVPKHIEVSFHPKTIAAKEKATVKITYNALKKNDFGPVEDKIVLITNESAENKKTLFLTADINEFYPPLSPEDAANAPKLSLGQEIYDFGSIKVNGTYTGEIDIVNTGKQDLTLKKVRSGASYVSVKADKTVVKAGQSAKLKITYKADGKMGLDNQFLWIHTNDPSRSTQNITLKANIIE